MLKVKVNKNYHGVLSVRDYDCVKAMKQGGMAIVHKNKVVLEITPDALDHALQTNRNPSIKSKFPPYKSYSLVDFRYNKKENEGIQASLI
tara:strand:- start:18 stop:287 length:270 start_codon:yes stop_codon:yes gene_type:complete